MPAGTNVGTTYLNVTANTAPYRKSLQGLTSVAGKLGKMVGGAFAIASLAKFGKQCVTLASDLQEVNNVTGKAFAGMQKQVDEWAQGAVNAYGLSETMAKSYAGTFGAMAGAFGLSQKEAFKMSTTLAGLAGDVASFYNVSQDEAFTKLKSVFTGETESLKGLGVVMTQTALDQYAMQQGFGKTVQQMTEAEKVSLRYGFVLNQLKFAQGDFAQTVGTSWANQVRLLQLNFDSLKATIGKSLMAVLMPVIKLINTILVGLTALARKFNNVFSRLTGIRLDDSTAQVSADLSSATGASDSLGESLGGSGKQAKKASKAVKELRRQLLGFDKITKLEKTSSGSGGGVGGIGGGGIGGIGGGGISLPDTANPIKKALEPIKRIKLPNNLVKAFEHLKTALLGLWDVAKRFGGYVWEKVLKPLGKWSINKLAPVLVDALASGIELLTSALEFLAPIAKWLWEKILVPVGKFIGNTLIKYLEWCIKKFKDGALVLKIITKGMAIVHNKYIKPFVQKYMPALKKGISAIGGFLKNMVIEKLATVVGKIDGIKQAWINLTNKPAELKADLTTTWNDLKDKWTALTDKLSGATVDIKAKIATTWSDLKDKWTALKNKFTGKTVDIKAKVASTWASLKQAWNKLLANFKDKTASIKLKLDVASKSLKGWINTNVIDRINSHVPDVLKKMGLKVPRLAQGGFVARNTPRLAVIGDNTHEGEIVSPESKLQAMADRASAKAGTSPEVIALLNSILTAIRSIDTDAYIDGKKITDVVVKQINKNTRATGHLAIEV